MQVQMRYVETTRAKGIVYYYYRRDGRRHGRLKGEPGSAEFLANYYRIHAGFEGRENIAIPNSFEDAAVRYLKSPEYAGLTDGSQKRYRIYLDKLRQTFGNFDVAAIRRKHLRAYRDTLQVTPAAANMTIAVARAFYTWAMDAYEIPVNPAAGIKSIKLGEHQPWPDGAVEAFFEKCPPEVGYVFAFGLYTGQRLGDILAMRWGDLDDEGIKVRQQKTGAELWVPIHPDLAGVIDALPKRGVVMLTTASGRAWTTDNYRDQFKRVCKKAKITGLVFHGLRKTAASRLAEAGCTTDEIKAITGHKTDQMASYYAKGADQKRKAKSAMKKLLDRG